MKSGKERDMARVANVETPAAKAAASPKGKTAGKAKGAAVKGKGK